VAALAALRGDIFLFKQAKKQSANLLQHLPSYAAPALESGLQALVYRWIGAKYGKLKKKQIALMSSKIDYKLLPLAFLMLFLPVFQKHAGIQTLSVIMGVFLLLASFEPKLRYWWGGYHVNTPN
jgi:hypothetical protein